MQELPRQYVVFVDLSSSALKADRRRWVGAVQAEIGRSLNFGDRLSLFPLHDNTVSAGALFNREIPVAAPYAGVCGDVWLNQRMREVRVLFDSVLAATVDVERCAERTDVFGAVEVVRHERAPGHHVVMIVCSDMLESTALMNLERAPLLPARIDTEIHRVARTYDWDSQTLGGVDVCVITPSSQIGKHLTQDPLVLERFYTRLFNALGARVMRFSPAAELMARN